MSTKPTSAHADGLTLRAYPGDGAVLLAFDLDESRQADLAGFAVEYTDPDGKTLPVLNRLSFGQAITSTTTPEQRKFIPTDEAPLQKFHWDHFPPDVKPGTFTYKATAMLFQPGSETAITPGPSAEVEVSLMPAGPTPFLLGFTRGYLSSQAYVDQFHNAPYEPSPSTFDFDTATLPDAVPLAGLPRSQARLRLRRGGACRPHALARRLRLRPRRARRDQAARPARLSAAPLPRQLREPCDRERARAESARLARLAGGGDQGRALPALLSQQGDDPEARRHRPESAERFGELQRPGALRPGEQRLRLRRPRDRLPLRAGVPAVLGRSAAASPAVRSPPPGTTRAAPTGSRATRSVSARTTTRASR